MKKLLVSLMAVSILSVGAANAGTLSNALNNAANKVGQREQSLTLKKKQLKNNKNVKKLTNNKRKQINKH